MMIVTAVVSMIKKIVYLQQKLQKMKRFTLLFAFLSLILPLYAEDSIPRSYIPEDHLAWFGLKGPVKDVREYDYNNYGKTLYRFDRQGRLVEFEQYGEPFIESGGCVFSLLAHYRYGYDKDGKILFLETYDINYNTVDDYTDLILELFPPKYNGADLSDKAEKEYGDTTSCFSLWKNEGDSLHYYGYRYDRHGNLIESVSVNPEKMECASIRVREFSYWEYDAFNLDFNYKGYVFEGTLYPLHDKRRLVLSYWCLDEEDVIYVTDAEGNEVPAASLYKDPFEGKTCSVIQTDSVSFSTRNYGRQPLHFYASSTGDSIAYTIDFECPLDVLDADPVSRRVLCVSNPDDWMWGEPGNEEEEEYKRPYVYLKGRVDEEWICANLLTTCP